jgi:hypothetical protein
MAVVVICKAYYAQIRNCDTKYLACQDGAIGGRQGLSLARIKTLRVDWPWDRAYLVAARLLSRRQ